MDEEKYERLAEPIRAFHVPRLQEIPDVGLYLEQVTRYVNHSLAGCGVSPVTASMVSNYVKQKIIPGPAKKTYAPESVAYLIFVACVKSVATMEDIRRLIAIQQGSYELAAAYDYFCEEFENLLQYVFGLRPAPAAVGGEETDEKRLLRAALLSATHKLYLDAYLRLLSGGEETT